MRIIIFFLLKLISDATGKRFKKSIIFLRSVQVSLLKSDLIDNGSTASQKQGKTAKTECVPFLIQPKKVISNMFLTRGPPMTRNVSCAQTQYLTVVRPNFTMILIIIIKKVVADELCLNDCAPQPDKCAPVISLIT